jgi:hypothetical protein
MEPMLAPVLSPPAMVVWFQSSPEPFQVCWAQGKLGG